ncbi:hypothetical protein GCM10009120_07820 [Sphingobacterium siyangense subsp. cladoniae]|uniref:hypothetical protein n=1 Tax=Sphingobacterium siyangense TaxID=459529 RepID=UPI0031F8D227
MKTSTRIGLSVMVAFMAIGFSAFKNAQSKSDNCADAWFVLKSGVAPTAVNARIASNYEPGGSTSCPGEDSYCGVFAENVAGQPNLTSGTQARTQIDNYFATGEQGERIGLKDN